jgi:E3 ubiquitin-protein ligase HECTD2
MTSAVVGSSDEALFQTHEQSGFERIIAGRVHPDGYRTFGRFMGMAAATGNPAGIPLPPIFFRRLLGQAVALDDIREFDEDWYNTAVQIMRLSSDEEILQLTLGDPEPLQGSGLHEPLTIANRDFQMQRAIDNIVTNNSPDQFAQIVEGFFSVIPHEMFADITGEDLQAMIVGNMDVAADDLITNLRIAGGVHAEWLHQVIQEFTPYLRQRFLRFVTGLSVVPAGGWSQLGELQVHMVARLESSSRVALPRSQTCFKTLYLPMYESVLEMREILTNVLLHAIEGGMQER